ncbi:MAG: 6,7-dimethyl-8-ribityllumazine synthase [Thermoproteaceae archaeon]|nr:6,7-dimethyl-8-ribityllumazine synthase [Thermoproteaceae archaeon]
MVKLAVVVAEFNYDITHMMLQKALEHAKFLGAEVTYVVKVPGVFDVPMVLRDLARKEDVDAIVTLGAVIQGATKHDEIVATHAARKILDIAIESDKPIALGVIGPGASRIQALERVEEYARRAVEAAVKLAKRKRLLREAKYTGATLFVE